MSDDDLIRRGDAVKVCRDHEAKAARQGRGDFIAHGIDADALAALPAVTVGVPTEAQIASACLSYDHSFGLMDGPQRVAMMHQAREWLHAWRKEFAALEPVAAPTPQQVVDTLKDAAAVAMTAREAALREAAAILHREIERVDAIAPDQKGNRNVSLFSVSSEYAEIEREILALIPKGADGG